MKEPADEPRDEIPAASGLLTRYEGGDGLNLAIRGTDTGAWCLRPLATEDRGALIAELVSAAVASDGGAALVLVPEVRYGSQVLDSLIERFPSTQRVDSAMSDGERAAAWVAGARGAPVLAGGRGGVLTPSPKLRLVVVDEEHHYTYKEDRAPRFDARTRRARSARASMEPYAYS